MKRDIDVGTLRAAFWTLRALRSVRGDLGRGLLRELVVPPPPQLPASAARGVNAVLRRRPNTCLERSLVLQRWHAAHGSVRDVVIGVTGASDFGAHAWLEGERDGGASFAELSRIRLVEPA